MVNENRSQDSTPQEEWMTERMVKDKHLEIIKNQVEERKWGREFYRDLADEMEGFVESALEGEMKVQIGKVFATGIGDHLAVQMFFPMAPDVILYDPIAGSDTKKNPDQTVKGRDALAGTPVIFMINDPLLKAEVEAGNTRDMDKKILASIQAKAKKVKDGTAASAVSYGGWGHFPPLSIGKGDIILEASNESDQPYEIVMLPGLIGSMNSLNPEILSPKGAKNLEKLTLGMMACQLENALEEMAVIMDPTTNGKPEEMASLYKWINGHSMGGYIAIVAARFNTELPVIEKFKEDPGAELVAEKPVMVGAEYKVEDMPLWMQTVVNTPGYDDHVPLLHGRNGAMVRLGVSELLRNKAIKGIRRVLLEAGLVPFVDGIFEGFLTPEKMLDGENVALGHKYSYARYPEFHSLCINLLDRARPLVGDKTLIDLQQGVISYLRVLFGGGDAILSHDIGEALVKAIMEGLILKKDQILNLPDTPHHPDWREFFWMITGRKLGLQQ